MKKKMLFLVFCICLLATNVTGQRNESTKVSTDVSTISQVPGSTFQVVRNISITEDSKSEDILISIDKKTNQFSLSIESVIKKGKLTIEVYDSSGKKQGNFTIATQLSLAKNEVVNGQFQKSWKNLPIGTWMVKIIPFSATAQMHIATSLID